jgi:tRNA(Ile)-lysidine synthase
VTAIVPKDKVAGGLAVRNRRAGDRLLPSAAGHRKLQDLLVDRKVPRAERDRVPIVVDAADRIVWVAGLVVDREFRVTDPAQAVVILRLKGVGGSC